MSLDRRAPLARGKGLKRTGGPKRRTRLSRFGRRARAALAGAQQFRRDVLARARGRCERCDRPTPSRDLDAHHLTPRSRGGKDDAKTNGAALCRPCHSAIHDHRAADWRRWVRGAKL